MIKDGRPVWAEINLDVLDKNIKNIKNKVKDKKIIAMIKADAYGHGSFEIARELEKNSVTSFGVAIYQEAKELRNKGIKSEINIFSYTPECFIEDSIREDFIINCLDYNYAKLLNEKALKLEKKARVLIAIDTGIGRLGFLPSKETIDEIEKISKLEAINMQGIYTHFSESDSKDKKRTNMQLEKFKSILGELDDRKIKFTDYHASNSGAIVDYEQAYFNCVRPGLLLYGYYPSDEIKKENIKVQPILSLKAKIIQISNLKKGSGISYGSTFITERDHSKIATLAIGYADGYFRSLSNKNKIIVDGKFVNQVGRVCMDHIMIDVTDIKNIKTLDVATIIGKDKEAEVWADDLAKQADTISYEILTSLSKRIPMVYMKNGKELYRKDLI